MGNEVGTYKSCDTGPQPDTTNQCSLTIDQVYTLPNFCSLSGLGGKSNREVWCGKLGTNEWGIESGSGNGQGCPYDDCGAYKKQVGGCCGGCCPIRGSGVNCVRKNFNGDAVQCCIADLECHPSDDVTNTSPPACFSDQAKKLTCDPCQRSLTSNSQTLVGLTNGTQVTCASRDVQGCQEVMLAYCSGADVDDQSWFLRWINAQGPQACTTALERNLFQTYPGLTKCDVQGALNLNGICTPLILTTTVTTSTATDDTQDDTGGVNTSALSFDGVVWGQQLMSAVFAKYKEQGFVIGAIPGTPGYSQFQDFLYSLGCQVPIIMQDSLTETCSIYTAQRLSLNPDVANWCGCYLPDAEYTQYVNDYQIDKQCTPMCNRNSTIQLVAGDNTPIKCNQTVCLIDDITINLNRTNVDGGINIAQICGNCSGTLGSSTSCSCIVQNNTIDAANAQLGSINILNACSSTTCTVKNPGFSELPPTIEVPCDQVSDPNGVYAQAQAAFEAQQAENRRKLLAIYLIILGIALLIFFLLWYFIRPDPKVAPPAVVRRHIKKNTNYNTQIGVKSINGPTIGGTEIGTKSINGPAIGGTEIGTKTYVDAAGPAGTGTGRFPAGDPSSVIGSRRL